MEDIALISDFRLDWGSINARHLKQKSRAPINKRKYLLIKEATRGINYEDYLINNNYITIRIY